MSIREKLRSNKSNIEESMGVRSEQTIKPVLSKAHSKDVGRRPDLNYGTISVKQIQPDPTQPRTEFDEKSINELAASFKAKGQLQAIRVRWSEDAKAWTIIAGERRWRAAQVAGLEKINCYFHEGELTESEIIQVQVIENIQRRSLLPMEEAKVFEKLLKLNNWKGKDVALSLGIHPTKVSRALALLKLPADLQTQVASGELPARTAYEISRIQDDDQRRTVASYAKNSGMTHKEVAKKIGRGRSKSGKRGSTGTRLTFQSSYEISVVVSKAEKATYAEIEVALSEALSEVQHRIENNTDI